MINKHYKEIEVKIADNRKELGEVAAQEAANTILSLLNEKEFINCVFAAAPSQNEFLACLVANKQIPWERVRAFHLDEYIGLPTSSSALFSNFLKRTIWDLVSFKEVHIINGLAKDSSIECARYTKLLQENPLDIAFIGIGENGHLAFNDPPVANFQDKEAIKIVELDLACRNQQVHDGCFAKLEDVPKMAFTLTIPTILSAKHIFCVVPGEKKASAVALALTGEVDTTCPASILQNKVGTRMYIDTSSASMLLL